MPLIRNRDDIDNLLGGPTPAEEKLLAATLAGELCRLGDDVPPEGTPAPQVHIRADFLRYLITGGCKDCKTTERGLRLYGGYITGELDLRFALCIGATSLLDCRFEMRIEAMQAKLKQLNLARSVVPGMMAEGAEIYGHLLLRDIRATSGFLIAGTTIGGQLICDRAEFYVGGGYSLSAEGTLIKGAVFFRDVSSNSEIRLLGAHVGGSIDFSRSCLRAEGSRALNIQNATVLGNVFFRKTELNKQLRLSGASIEGQLVLIGAKLGRKDETSLAAQRMTVTEGFFFRDVEPTGTIDLTAAKVGGLVDDLSSWSLAQKIKVNGFEFNRINDTRFTKLSERLEWLKKCSACDDEFFPQPYTQLTKIYRETGHDADARAVLFEREKQRRIHKRSQNQIVLNGDLNVAFKSLWHDFLSFFQLVWDFILRFVVGYGVRPLRSLWCLTALTLLATLLAHMAWDEGSVVPSSPVILASENWISIAENDTLKNPAAHWSDRTVPGRDYATFNRYAYAADLVIPIIDLGQTDTWAPSTNRGPWGKLFWAAGFFISVAGWIITALAAAAITGIIRRD